VASAQWYTNLHLASLHTDNHASISSLNFLQAEYSLPDTRPTVLKHWRKVGVQSKWIKKSWGPCLRFMLSASDSCLMLDYMCVLQIFVLLLLLLVNDYKVKDAIQQSRWDAHLPFQGHWASRWICHRVCDACLRDARRCLPSQNTSLFFSALTWLVGRQ